MPEPTPKESDWKKGCLFFSLGSAMTLLILVSIPFLLIFSALTFLSSVWDEASAYSYQKNDIQETIISGDSLNDEIIGVIKIDGVISSETRSGHTSCHDISYIISKLLNDHSRKLKALIIRVNSPGGEVTASDVIYNAIDKVKKKNIPVIVQMESMAASGGYYISCHADHIVANPNTFTGSIGVIISGLNIEEGMHKLGLKQQVFTSGPFKDMLSPTRSMTTDEEIYVQSLVDESYARFVQLVSTGRNIPAEKLKETKAIDGRIISGKQAHHVGLVDSLGYWEDAVNVARTLSNSQNSTIIRFQKKMSFSDLLFDFGMEASSKKTISIEMGGNTPAVKAGIPYLLPYSYVTGSLINP